MNRRVVSLVLIFAFAFGAGFALRTWTARSHSPPSLIPTSVRGELRSISVPRVAIGTRPEEAAVLIRNAGLVATVKSIDPLQQSPVQVVAQFPSAGSVVPEGTSITLFAR